MSLIYPRGRQYLCDRTRTFRHLSPPRRTGRIASVPSSFGGSAGFLIYLCRYSVSIVTFFSLLDASWAEPSSSPHICLDTHMPYRAYKGRGIRVRNHRRAEPPRGLEPAGLVRAVGGRDRASARSASADGVQAPA